MLTATGLIVLGLLLLILGGEFLVRSAQGIAGAFGISPLVVGLTVVAYGTSAPELATSLIAGIQGHADIAVSNVVGSNIFNICMILGICALIRPLDVHPRIIRLEGPILVGCSLLLWLLCRNGILGSLEGWLLTAGIVVYTYWIVTSSGREGDLLPDSVPEPEKAIEPQTAVWRPAAGVGLSLGLLVGGSYCLVQGTVEVASILGASQSLVALTVVAAGTSLPELATSLVATLRGQSDIAVGNVLGSNLFNILLILGLTAGINLM